jgi:signal-transduction protein with cAMP-binding, CBS, and nucleotidyltransferase domain
MTHRKTHRSLQEILRDQDLLHVTGDTNVQAAARHMAARNVAAVLVIDGGALKGIFTERDLLRRIVAQGREPAQTPIAEAMTTEMISIGAGHMGFEAFQLMHEHNVRHVVVTGLEGACPFGIVSIRDFPPCDRATYESEIAFEEHVWEVV